MDCCDCGGLDENLAIQTIPSADLGSEDFDRIDGPMLFFCVALLPLSLDVGLAFCFFLAAIRRVPGKVSKNNYNVDRGLNGSCVGGVRRFGGHCYHEWRLAD